MIPDVGDWGNGPEDPYTPPEQMRRFYFRFNFEKETRFGTGRVPPSWSKKRIREHGLFAVAEDLSVSFDVRLLRDVVEYHAQGTPPKEALDLVAKAYAGVCKATQIGSPGRGAAEGDRHGE